MDTNALPTINGIPYIDHVAIEAMKCILRVDDIMHETPSLVADEAYKIAEQMAKRRMQSVRS